MNPYPINDQRHNAFVQGQEQRSEELIKFVEVFNREYRGKEWSVASFFTAWENWLRPGFHKDSIHTFALYHLEEKRENFTTYRCFMMHETQVVASAALYYYHDQPEIWMLSSLYVREDYRKMGIGNKMQQYREALAVSTGKPEEFRLWAEKGSWMQSWYERRGYIMTDERNTGSEYQNDYWMVKSIE